MEAEMEVRFLPLLYGTESEWVFVTNMVIFVGRNLAGSSPAWANFILRYKGTPDLIAY